MITEDFVSLEVAKLLKEKGFSEPVHYDYHYTISVPQFHKKAHNFNGEEYANCCTEWFSAPTLQMALKWLRKNHQIFIRPNTSFLYPIKWYSEIFCYGDNLKTQQDIKTEYYDSPEEACEAAIKYCLENLI